MAKAAGEAGVDKNAILRKQTRTPQTTDLANQIIVGLIPTEWELSTIGR